MSQSTIAKKTEYSQPEVSEAINRLAERGDIIILERPKAGSHKPLKITLSDERKKLFSKKKDGVSPIATPIGHIAPPIGGEKNSSLSYRSTDTNDSNDNNITLSERERPENKFSKPQGGGETFSLEDLDSVETSRSTIPATANRLLTENAEVLDSLNKRHNAQWPSKSVTWSEKQRLLVAQRIEENGLVEVLTIFEKLPNLPNWQSGFLGACKNQENFNSVKQSHEGARSVGKMKMYHPW